MTQRSRVRRSRAWPVAAPARSSPPSAGARRRSRVRGAGAGESASRAPTPRSGAPNRTRRRFRREPCKSSARVQNCTDVTEVGTLTGTSGTRLDRLWIRGGFPDSFLAVDDAISLRWRQDFIRTYLERDIPQLGPRI